MMPGLATNISDLEGIDDASLANISDLEAVDNVHESYVMEEKYR